MGEQHITSAMVRQCWGDMEVIATKLRQRARSGLGMWLEWLNIVYLEFVFLGGWLKYDLSMALNKGAEIL